VLGTSMALIIRPLLVGLCLIPARLRRNEQAFVPFAGLKGAVPILLGSLLLAANIPGADRLYGIVIVVVSFSVLVQGSLVPTVVRALHLPMRVLQPQPWSNKSPKQPAISGTLPMSMAGTLPMSG
jgi:cell volume regulation protein A